MTPDIFVPHCWIDGEKVESDTYTVTQSPWPYGFLTHNLEVDIFGSKEIVLPICDTENPEICEACQ